MILDVTGFQNDLTVFMDTHPYQRGKTVIFFFDLWPLYSISSLGFHLNLRKSLFSLTKLPFLTYRVPKLTKNKIYHL